VEQFANGLAGVTELALDTEGASFHRFVDRIYLLQLSTRDQHAVIDPIPIGNADHNPSRPSVLTVDKTVWLAWKEFDGQESEILAIVSRDGGRSWSPAKEVGRTHGESDHPLLISGKGGVFLSWLTHDEGYRLLPLEAGS